MSKRYIISLDQGTTSSRTILFDSISQTIVGNKSRPLKQIYPQPGWVEHDPMALYEDQLNTFKDVLTCNNVQPQDIACIGITNQRESVVVWEKDTGKPIYNSIVWQCRRTSGVCQQLKDEGYERLIQNRTGLVLDAYFSGTKIKWILDNVDGAREKALNGKLLAGNIDTWLIWNLTKGKSHITDYSNASRTMLFDIVNLKWDKEILELLNIPEAMLPKVVPSSGISAYVDKSILGYEIPISGIAGDQQAALFGQACFDIGSAKNTYGTGCFILMNTGNKPVNSEHRLLSTIAWKIGAEVVYALEGSVFNAGSAIQWLRDEVKLIDNAPQADIDAEKVSDTGGVYVVPAFTGLGAPYWDMFARGTIVGLTRGSSKEHIIRAVLEAIAYRSRDIFEVMQKDSLLRLKELKVDGGASVSPFLMQFQSDILNINVKRPKIVETTALGAAYLAGLGVGIWESKEEIANSWVLDKLFKPSMEKEKRVNLYAGWQKAVKRSLKWEDIME